MSDERVSVHHHMDQSLLSKLEHFIDGRYQRTYFINIAVREKIDRDAKLERIRKRVEEDFYRKHEQAIKDDLEIIRKDEHDKAEVIRIREQKQADLVKWREEFSKGRVY